VDVTANYLIPGVANGALDLLGALDYGKNKVLDEKPLPPELAGTGLTSLFDPLSRIALEKERPTWRSTLTAEYSQARWHGLVRSLWYGSSLRHSSGPARSANRNTAQGALWHLSLAGGVALRLQRAISLHPGGDPAGAVGLPGPTSGLRTGALPRPGSSSSVLPWTARVGFRIRSR
jgi:hypothetical protein